MTRNELYVWISRHGVDYTHQPGASMLWLYDRHFPPAAYRGSLLAIGAGPRRFHLPVTAWKEVGR